MRKLIFGRNGQNILEFTMLILIVSAALVAMRLYVQRSLNVHLKGIQQEISESTRGD